MNEQFRPLPGDTGGEEMMAMFDATSEDWVLAIKGGFHTGAAETMKAEGTAHQRVVVMEWPGRLNHSDEPTTVRLMMSPRDAASLARALAHTAGWMLTEGADRGR